MNAPQSMSLNRKGALPRIDLPIARRQPASFAFEEAHWPFELSQKLSTRVKAAAKTLGCSESTLLLAVYACLLYRYSGQNEIVIGGLLEDGIATYRTAINEDSSFASLVTARHQSLYRAASGDNTVPFWDSTNGTSKSVAQSFSASVEVDGHDHTEGNNSEGAFFPILYRHRVVPSSGSSNGNGEPDANFGTDLLRDFRHRRRASYFDLALDVDEYENSVSCSLLYNRHLFDDWAIQNLAGHFMVLMDAALAQPTLSVDVLPLLTEPEEQRLLFDWNNTQQRWPTRALIHRLIEAQTAKTPARQAVQFGRETLTYDQLNQKADCVAHYLQSQGVSSGSLIGLYVDRSLAMMIGLLGILKANCCYVPLDPAFPEDRLSYMVEDAELAFLLTQESLCNKSFLKQTRTLCLDSDWSEIAAPERSSTAKLESADETNRALDFADEAQPEDLAYVIYTSGSTGRPKGVQISHRAAVNFLQTMAERPGLNDQDTLLAVTTLSFDIALLELVLPLTVGARVVIASRTDATDARRLMTLLEEQDVSLLQATPVTWRMLFDAGWQGKSNLCALCGGEPFPVDLAQRLLDCTAAAWNMYGPTETTVWSTIHQVESAAASISIGRPIANTEIYILDAKLQPVPVGVPGILYIGGSGLARGYLKQPALTAEKFIPHPFQKHQDARIYNTGDMAKYLPDGTIECLGRIDHQVKVRGFRIELGEIESCLSERSEIGQAVVVAQENGSGDKILVAYVVPEIHADEPYANGLGHGGTNGSKRPNFAGDTRLASEQSLSSPALRAFLKTKMPNYMIPSAFVMMDSFPLTPNGKVDRKVLPLPETLPDQRSEGFVAPRSKIEITLATLWETVLNHSPIGIDDNFFEFGGTSLNAVRLFAQIEQKFGQQLQIATLLEAPTIASLAAFLDGDNGTTPTKALVRIKQGTDAQRPPIFLCHGAGGAVLLYRSLADHLPPEQTVFGIQAIGLDARVEPHQSIEEMADFYLDEIRAVQPRGPYLLCGYCMGGSIVFELAQRFHQMGEEVGLLALLETYNWYKGATADQQESTKEKLIHAVEKIEFHLRNLLLSDSEGKKLFFREKFDELRRRIKMMGLQSRPQEAVNPGGVDDGDGQIQVGDDIAFATTARVWEINDAASLLYQPKPYAGRILHVVTRKEYSRYAKPEMMWDKIAEQGVDKVILNVYPAGMLIEPFVMELAKALQEHIDIALEDIALEDIAFEDVARGHSERTQEHREEDGETVSDEQNSSATIFQERTVDAHRITL